MTGGKEGSAREVSKRVPLGRIFITRGVDAKLTEEDIADALARHSAGDWGRVCEEDRKLNDQALEQGQRLLSSYESRSGEVFWVITEWDRSVTTVLLPEEY